MRDEDKETARAGDAWSGAVFLWRERGLFLGGASDTSAHAPHAIKVCLAIHGSFRLRTNIDDDWHECEAIALPPDQPHQLDGRGTRLALFYLLPETEAGQRILKKLSEASFSRAPQAVRSTLLPRLRRYLEQGCDVDEAAELCDELVYRLAPARDQPTFIDCRVTRALEYLRSTLDRQVTSEEIAAVAQLSPSRIAHLFREQSGLPLRRYLLWLRLCAALEQMATSHSLTDAAHASGFADSAHLSRTFRRMHGIAPSELYHHSRFIQS